jgi:hypothetical protein
MMQALAAPITTEEPENACKVQAFYKHSQLRGLWIELTGKLRFPSKNKKPVFRNAFTGKRFMPKNTSWTIDRDAITVLYRNACAGKLPTFNDELVKLTAILPAPTRGRDDSHNRGESIADWLQHIGVVADDSQVEMHCIKRNEYARFSPFLLQDGCPPISDDRNCTTLILLRKDEQIERIIQAHILELVRISAGRTVLIG